MWKQRGVAVWLFADLSCIKMLLLAACSSYFLVAGLQEDANAVTKSKRLGVVIDKIEGCAKVKWY